MPLFTPAYRSSPGSGRLRSGAFQFETAAPYLNAARNPAFFTEAVSLIKRTRIGERVNIIEARADVSNLFNRTSFGGINVNLTDTNFGRATGPQQGPRVLQAVLKINI